MPTSNERKMLSSNEALKELRYFRKLITNCPVEFQSYLSDLEYLWQFSGKNVEVHITWTQNKRM